MTISIIAHDPRQKEFGVAVASFHPNVGAMVSAGSSYAGAVASQGRINPAFGIQAMRLLRKGASADAVIDEVIGRDPQREERQLHVIDAAGKTACFTGTQLPPWSGSIAGEGVSVAGNILAGPQVVISALDAYEGARASDPMSMRLLVALEAAIAAGGDWRGLQSASVRTWSASGGDVDEQVVRAADPIRLLRQKLVKVPMAPQPAMRPGPGLLEGMLR